MKIQLEQYFARKISSMISRDGRVLVAVSGGADSVALLRMLERCPHLKSGQLHVACFHHGVRSEASQEQEWVRQLCLSLNVPFFTNSIPAEMFLQPERHHDEQSLRQQRYQFLEQVANQESCRYLCLAHHAGDQVETLLHHLVRGTGLRGLTGIPEIRQLDDGLTLIRPLLEVTRDEIMEFLNEIGQDYCEDPTNAMAVYTRNRIRHELIPDLETYNSQVGNHLRELSRQVREIHRYHQALVREVLVQAVLSAHETAIRVRIDPLLSLPMFLRREFLVELWDRSHWPRQKMTASDWQQLAEMIDATSGRLEFPGQIVAERRALMLVMRR